MSLPRRRAARNEENRGQLALGIKAAMRAAKRARERARGRVRGRVRENSENFGAGGNSRVQVQEGAKQCRRRNAMS